MQRCTAEGVQDLYLLHSAKQELKVLDKEDVFSLTLEIQSWCFISVNSTSNLPVAYTYILKTLVSLLFLGFYTQKMPSRKSQLLPSTSCLCFNTKLTPCLPEDFSNLPTDRENHSFEDPLILPLSISALNNSS